MDNIAVLADPETLLGFRLAGIQKTFEANGDVDAKMMEALHTPDVGILIVSGDVFTKLGAKTQKDATESAKPVVVVIPQKGAKASGSGSNLAAMVKRAIGVDILK